LRDAGVGPLLWCCFVGAACRGGIGKTQQAGWWEAAGRGDGEERRRPWSIVWFLLGSYSLLTDVTTEKRPNYRWKQHVNDYTYYLQTTLLRPSNDPITTLPH
jgi:hypothetical protein